MMALKAYMPSDKKEKQFPLGISAIMSGDGSQLLSVDSTTGRIIHRNLWEANFHLKMLKKEIPPTYTQLVLDFKSPTDLVDKSGDSIEGWAPTSHLKFIVLHF